MSVNRYSVFFKKWGKFHYRIESFTGYSRPRVRKLPQTAFRQLSSIKSLRGLPLPRVASGTPGKAPHLPQTTSWLHRATIAGSPIDAPPLPVARERSKSGFFGGSGFFGMGWFTPFLFRTAGLSSSQPSEKSA